MSDTAAVQKTRFSPRVGGSRRSARLTIALGAALHLLAALPGWTAAEPNAHDARVVWVRGPYAYVAARDSLAIPPFSRLTFMMKSKPVAAGTVERTVDGGMAVARITSGSLAGVKHLDRLRILPEPHPVPRLLRVGCPSARRANPHFVRDSTVSATGHRHVFEGGAPTRFQIRRHDSLDAQRRPDTLAFLSFDDPTDQEIALERGELDVGLFLPGELSSRMREHPRWKDRLPWSPEGAADSVESTPHQIVCQPELLPYLKGLRPSELASLLQYAPPARRP